MGQQPEDLNAKTYHDWIGCVVEAYQDLSDKFDQIIVGGESMGAVLALYLASVHTDIKALLLYSPALIVPTLRLSRWLRIFMPIISKSNYDNEMRWQGYTVYPLNAAYEFVKLQNLVMGKLSDINMPTGIFHGIYDKTIDPIVSDLIADNIKLEIKEIYRMKNSGHVMLLDREFEYVADLSMEFLKSNHML